MSSDVTSQLAGERSSADVRGETGGAVIELVSEELSELESECEPVLNSSNEAITLTASVLVVLRFSCMCVPLMNVLVLTLHILLHYI